MQPVYYDLHIHTALSPCANDDMLPSDIAGMAMLNGLDVIAITDHNSVANVKAVIDAAKALADGHDKLKKDLLVLAGIEVTTSEEVHALCLFEAFDTAQEFETELSKFYLHFKNRKEIFGEQLICDSQDNIIGTVERMLSAPTDITFENLFALAQKYEAAFVPAHVDRGAFSVYSNLGFLPPNLDISTVEFTSHSVFGENSTHKFELFPDKKYIFSSDAHQLHSINEREHHIMLSEISAKAIINYLRV